MSHRITRRVATLASLLCALITPAVAIASRPRTGTGTGTTTTTTTTTATSTTSTGTTTTGGSGLGGTGTTTTSGGSNNAPVGSAPVTGVVPLAFGQLIWASADGITIGATGSALPGNPLSFSGTAPTADAGSTVLIRYAAPSAPGGWVQVAQAVVDGTGGFTATWNAAARGLLAFTVTLVPSGAIPAADPPSAAIAVQVFSSSLATIYGPGLWGHKTACGERLRRTTLGVASRTAKCGTEVAVAYGGREIVVPVIDRGPFHSRAKWDLTTETAKALGIKATVTVRTIEPWPQSQQLSALS
jgi:rare lipoprotein A